MHKLTATDANRWLTGLEKELYRTSTINVMHSAARLFFYFLITEGDVVTNPFDTISYLPKDEVPQRLLTEEEVKRLMAVPDTSTYSGLLDRTMMELFYSSGIRVSELINLQLDRVDLVKRRALCKGKGNKERFVIFGRGTRNWLKRYLAARALILRAHKSTYLFLRSNGKQLYEVFIWRRIKEYGQMAGLKDVSPHVLRHSFATHLHEGGASIGEVQELLGHKDPESTETYIHPPQEHLRKIYDKHHPRASLNRGPPKRNHGPRRIEGNKSEE